MKNLVIIATFLNSVLIYGQDKLVLQSHYLTLPDTVLIFKPAGYSSDSRYPLVYLLHGYSENYMQWATIVDLQALSNQYQMILVTPEAFSSFYLNSEIDSLSRYEDFFFKELVPKIHASYFIDENNIFISGLSMGGYGALRYLIMHPDYFNTAAATSGALNIEYPLLLRASLEFWNNSRLTDDISRILGTPMDNDWNKHSIVNLLLEQVGFNKPFLIDCGREDLFYNTSLEIHLLATSLGLPVSFISQPGGHNFEYWTKSIDQHLIYFKQHLKTLK